MPVPAITRRRLAPLVPDRDPWSWAVTGFVVLVAAVLRFAGLGHPPGKIFDEVYYARDGYGLLSKGVEWNYVDNGPAYVVHPPLGKWLIAIGEWAFGYADTESGITVAGHIVTTSPEFGWRFSAAVAGVVSVLLMVRIGRRLLGSTVLGGLAGLLLAFDGFHFVLSRSALLDIFLMLFLLAAFGALLVDRDRRRQRLLDGVAAATVPWWRLAAAVLFGCAVAVKWSALAFLPFLLLVMLWWEAGARRSLGEARPWRSALRAEASWLGIYAVVIVGVYLASWTGWFLGDDGYHRHWLADTGRAEPPVIGALQNLIRYHDEAYGFHSTLAKHHPNQSWPWQWLLLGKPVAFHFGYSGEWGTVPVTEVLLLGTPLLWWSFLPALAGTLWLGIARRDWRAGTILLGVFVGLAPWFYYALDAHRTMFSFYTAPALPFLVLAVVYVLGAVIGRPGTERRFVGSLMAGSYVVLVLLCFAFFHPIFVGQSLSPEDWNARMWLGTRWWP